jgi:threonylcarbamoyladenosine tRNA methylthiotransferase MtaB
MDSRAELARSGRVRFVTFGCKANQYDTQVLREGLARAGLAESDDEPELVVINTCTVTAEAGRKARQLARRLKREHPGVRIAMTGCLAESDPEELAAIDGVDWVIGNGDAKLPVNFLRQIGAELSPEELGIPAGITRFAGHTRAFLKIQDGCDMACAFCIIPSVRGPNRSRGEDELVAETRRLLASGHREVVLCGIHIGHWGRDLGSHLGELLEALAAVDAPDGADWRLRLSSIEATEVVGPVLETLARHPRRMAPHLHLPLQAGDDGVLAAMNRWYDAETFRACCDEIRATLDRPALTSDVLVGFPGEDEAAFENTLAMVRAVGFARVHAFPFSARPGTAAEGRGARVTPEQLRDRKRRLAEVGKQAAEDYRRGLDGARDALLCEGTDGAGLVGRYQRVELAEPLEAAGGLVEVRLAVEEGPRGPRLVGEPLAAGAASR